MTFTSEMARGKVQLTYCCFGFPCRLEPSASSALNGVAWHHASTRVAEIVAFGLRHQAKLVACPLDYWWVCHMHMIGDAGFSGNVAQYYAGCGTGSLTRLITLNESDVGMKEALYCGSAVRCQHWSVTPALNTNTRPRKLYIVQMTISLDVSCVDIQCD